MEKKFGIKKRHYKNIAYIALMLAFVFQFIGDTIKEFSLAGMIVLGLSIIAAILSTETPMSYAVKFKKEDWRDATNGSGFEIFVAQREHNMGLNPMLQATENEGDISDFVMCSLGYDKYGNVYLQSGSKFNGHLIMYKS